MIERGARPKDAHLFVHPLASDAKVISYSTLRSNPQLLENIGRVLEGKELAAAQPVGQINNDVGIAPGLTRWIDAVAPVNHPAFGAATHPVFFLMQAACQDHIRMMRGFRKKEIDHAEELQLRQRLAG